LLIHNQKNIVQYYSISEKNFVDPKRKISKSLLSPKSYSAFLENETRLPTHLNAYQPVLPDIYPIPARTKWSFENGKFLKIKKNIKLASNYNSQSCLKNADRLIKILQGKVAIEISGGLDSSIMIGIFQKLGYEPLLIGTVSQLYKFRTERHIQHTIAKNFKNVILYESTSRQFTNLLDTPDHFLPNYASLHHSVCAETVRILEEEGVKYVLQGTAFDCMLVEGVDGNPNEMPWPVLEGDWLHDYVFAPKGLAYIDVAALNPVRQTLLSLRNGQKQDIQKWWARKFFADLIPSELSQYAFKANFGPLWWDGLLSSADQITRIMELAWQVTSLPVFKRFQMKSLFDNMNHGTGRQGFAPLAYANWIHALHKSSRLID